MLHGLSDQNGKAGAGGKNHRRPLCRFPGIMETALLRSVPIFPDFFCFGRCSSFQETFCANRLTPSLAGNASRFFPKAPIRLNGIHCTESGKPSCGFSRRAICLALRSFEIDRPEDACTLRPLLSKSPLLAPPNPIRPAALSLRCACYISHCRPGTGKERLLLRLGKRRKLKYNNIRTAPAHGSDRD